MQLLFPVYKLYYAFCATAGTSQQLIYRSDHGLEDGGTGMPFPIELISYLFFTASRLPRSIGVEDSLLAAVVM
jgi:hypothetical protein